MAAFTSKATGNWSSGGQTTWNEVGVPGSGDTVSIGAHTITVDVNTTVGTSPNDATTKVVDLTSASSVLKVAAGVTLTVLGNRGAVNGSTFQQEAGSTVTFDNSASGGSPVYTDINVGFTKYVFNGAAGNLATVQAISGQQWTPNPSWNAFTATYTTFRRLTGLRATSASGGSTGTSITRCAFDACGTASIPAIDISQASATLDFTFTDNTITNTVHATDSLRLQLATAATTSVRTMARNVMDKSFNNLAKGLILNSNVMLGGVSCSNTAGLSTFATPPTNNFLVNSLGLNGGNGMVVTGSWTGNYCVSDRGVGNGHFLAPQAKNAIDETHQQWIFESQEPDLVDVGDCFLMNASVTSGGNKVISQYNLVLPNGNTGVVTSGTLVTVFATTTAPLFESYHDTVNVNNSTLGGSLRGAVSVAEGGTGAAGQVTAVKSGLFWGASASQGYVGERVTGTVQDILTASGVDYNWRYNTSDGDNQRGFEDRAGSGALWAAGDAVAAGVDAHSGSGDPRFVDATRNVATWCAARGYGASTYAAGKAALQADPTRIADLITWVRAGFAPRNAELRNAGHDGVTVGAVEGVFASSRPFNQVASLVVAGAA